ncbi:hypothetical protein ACOMHN_004599 [Nucella lapillus]
MEQPACFLPSFLLLSFIPSAPVQL